MSDLLNDLAAQPRDTTVRDGFRFDAALLRAPRMLALRIKDCIVNIFVSLDGIGEYPQVEARSTGIEFGSHTVRILALDALLLSGQRVRIGEAEARQRMLLATLQGLEFGTR